MRFRLQRFVAIATLAAHVFAPFAAYATARPGPGTDDVCSVAGAAGQAAQPGERPAPAGHAHDRSHCPWCPGGGAAAALPAGASSIGVLPDHHAAPSAPVGARLEAAAPPTPAARGPPSTA